MAYPPNRGIENSLQAFANAVRLGYRYLETDVHASRDGVVFAFHDQTLDRLTDRRGRIRDLPAEQVAQARIGGREPVPLLIELLEAFPDIRLNIDVKDETAIEPCVRVLRQANALGRVCIASFSTRRLRRLRHLLGSSATSSLGSAEVAALRLGPVDVVRSLGRRRGASCAQVPHRAGPLTVVDERFVHRSHDLGLEVHVWTVDAPAQMHALLDLGVDGLITDEIQTLKDVLVQRGQWDGMGP